MIKHVQTGDIYHVDLVPGMWWFVEAVDDRGKTHIRCLASRMLSSWQPGQRSMLDVPKQNVVANAPNYECAVAYLALTRGSKL